MSDGATLAGRLAAVAASTPEHAAVIDGPVTIRYRELADAVESGAGLLERAGVLPGARVALLLPNGRHFSIWFFAIARLGAVAAPLNPGLTARELSALIRDSDASALVTTPDLCAAARAALVESGRPHLPLLLADDTERRASCRAPAPSADSPVLLLRSSGSTGQPKPVVRTHANLLWEVDRLIETFTLGPPDRMLGVAPFSHVNGLMRSLVAAALAGATLVTHHRFERSEVARLIEEQRIHVFVGVPFMFSVLADARWPRAVSFSTLRLCVSASAPLKAAVSRRFHERYGRHVLQLYGTTETGSIAVNRGDGAADALESVGQPLAGVSVRITGASGEVLPAGVAGDIGIRSPAMSGEYAGQPDATAAAFRDGYFVPGDVGYVDDGGRIYLSGRRSLFINRGGFKVNPQEIEDVLEEHPGVHEAAVTGVDTDAGDQRIRACVVLSGPCDERTLLGFCRERLADYKLPSLIEFRSTLPRTATGKLLRSKL